MTGSASNPHLAAVRVERLHAVIEELLSAAPRLVTASELSARTGVTTRTIERDLAALQAVGLPISARSGPGGGYTLHVARRLDPVSFSSGEAAALVVSLLAVGPSSSASAQRATTKLLRLLQPEAAATN